MFTCIKKRVTKDFEAFVGTICVSRLILTVICNILGGKAGVDRISKTQMGIPKEAKSREETS